MAKKDQAYQHQGRPCVIDRELLTPKPLLIRYTDDHGGLCRVFHSEIEKEEGGPAED